MQTIKRRVLAFLVSLTLMFGFVAALPTAAYAAPGYYNAGDIAVINSIITNNGLNWPLDLIADGNVYPPQWTGVIWSDDVTNRRIEWLNIEAKDLTGALDVSGLTALLHLDCYNNNLNSLNVSGLTAMKYLNCHNNNLNSLDVSGLTALEALDCSDNNLSSLDVSGLTALKSLFCSNINLSSLDFSGLTALKEIYCSQNNLSSLDVSSLTALIGVDCSFNNLSSLDVSSLTALIGVDCSFNNLSSLNVSGCTMLHNLFCQDNNLTALDVSGLTVLSWMDVRFNYLADESKVVGITDAVKFKGWEIYTEEALPFYGFYFTPQKVIDIPTPPGGTIPPTGDSAGMEIFLVSLLFVCAAGLLIARRKMATRRCRLTQLIALINNNSGRCM